MNYYLKLMFTALTCTIMLASTALAETRWVEVEINSTVPFSTVTGIIFSEGQSYQTAEARVSTVDSVRSIIAIPFDSELRAQQNLLVYAIATTTAGDTFYSNVKTTLPDIDRASGFAQSACVPDTVPSSMQNELSLVANLLKVRAKRRAHMQAQLKQKLTGDFLEKMKRYELGFGLNYATPLSPELPAPEIVDRLNRILHTLKKISTE